MLGVGMIIPCLRDLTIFLAANSGFSVSPVVLMGLLMAAYSVSQMVSAPIIGRISDRIGRKPVLLFSLAGNIASYAVWILSSSYGWFLAGRILSGITGGNISIAQSILADHTSVSNRAKSMGLMGAMIGLGFVVGPVVGLLMIDFNPSFMQKIFFNPFSSIGLSGLILGIFALGLTLRMKIKTNQNSSPRHINPWRILHSIHHKSLKRLYFVQLMGQVSFVFFEVVFIWLLKDQYQLDTRQTYITFGGLGILLALIQGGLYRRLVKFVPIATLARQGLILGAVCLIALPFWPLAPTHSFFILLAGGLIIVSILSYAMAITSPSLTAYASITAPTSEQGEVMGIMQGLAAMARAVVPLVATSLYDVHLAIPFVIAGIVSLIGWLIFRQVNPVADAT